MCFKLTHRDTVVLHTHWSWKLSIYHHFRRRVSVGLLLWRNLIRKLSRNCRGSIIVSWRDCTRRKRGCWMRRRLPLFLVGTWGITFLKSKMKTEGYWFYPLLLVQETILCIDCACMQTHSGSGETESNPNPIPAPNWFTWTMYEGFGNRNW